jgi:hypothetical protein
MAIAPINEERRAFSPYNIHAIKEDIEQQIIPWLSFVQLVD